MEGQIHFSEKTGGNFDTMFEITCPAFFGWTFAWFDTLALRLNFGPRCIYIPFLPP